jgi:AraC-like DNA-binding protein
MIERSHATRIRDFGCGELLTVASAHSTSLHYYEREADHPKCRVEHEYPSHSLIFTESGEWGYHGMDPDGTIDERTLVAGTGLREYACSHSPGIRNECFIIAINNDAFDDEACLFAKAVLSVTPEMRAHRRAILNAANDPERLESLAFSLYDLVARTATSATHVRTTDVRMVRAMRYIDERCARPIAVADIARELHLSRFTFTRRFLAQTGTSPHRYITTIRIARAKEQLRATTRTIEEVALANGFGSIAHFSNAFRRIAGVAPSAYRRLSAR